MKEPVILCESGLSYESSNIEEWIRNHGCVHTLTLRKIAASAQQRGPRTMRACQAEISPFLRMRRTDPATALPLCDARVVPNPGLRALIAACAPLAPATRAAAQA